MLKDPKVRKVSLNTELGVCSICMENGDTYQAEDIYFQEDFYEYVRMLQEEDNMVFSDNTIWMLNTQDAWEGWKNIFTIIGAAKVLFVGNNDTVRGISLKGSENR